MTYRHLCSRKIGNFCHICENIYLKQGERFNQYIKVIGERYQGRSKRHMMPDYYWTIHMPTQKEVSRTKNTSFQILILVIK